MKNIRALIITLLLSGLAVGQSNIRNAKMQTRSAAAGLESQVNAIVHQGSAAWIAWQLPSVNDENSMSVTAATAARAIVDAPSRPTAL
jgi:hypothetical protein